MLIGLTETACVSDDLSPSLERRGTVTGVFFEHEAPRNGRTLSWKETLSRRRRDCQTDVKGRGRTTGRYKQQVPEAGPPGALATPQKKPYLLLLKYKSSQGPLPFALNHQPLNIILIPSCIIERERKIKAVRFDQAETLD